MKLDQTVDIGTDVASFFLFHPDDLKHRENDPIAWYAYGFASEKEFKAGNLVAFQTGSDGGYQFRLTSGDLTDKEREAEAGCWEWGLTVRHGKVLLDNGNYLPSESARDLNRAPREQWVTIPKGEYRVTVHPIERKDNTLPDYVVRFEPVDKPLHLAESSGPPYLEPSKDSPPTGSDGVSADDTFPEKSDDEEPLAKTYPLLLAEGQYVLPGGGFGRNVPEELYNAVREKEEWLQNEKGDAYVVVSPTDQVPTLGTVCWVNGASWLRNSFTRISMMGKRLVRVTGLNNQGKLLPIATVEPVIRPDNPVDRETFAALQKAFAAYAEKHQKGKDAIPSFDQERAEAMTKGAALTNRLITLLPLPVEKRFELQGASDTIRARELIAFMEADK